MMVGENDLIDSIFNSEELAIYESESVKDVVDYKWRVFSRPVHRIGACIHIFYMCVLILYINIVFLEPEIVYDESGVNKLSPPPSKTLLYLSMICLIYPLLYDGTQMHKQGITYYQDPWNYIDILHISMGYINVYFQMFNGTWQIDSKIVMILVILLALIKTFFFLRIL